MRVRLQLRRAQIQIAAAMALLAGALVALPVSYSFAQDAKAHHGLTAEEFSSQSRQIIRRAPRRVRIYSPRTLGPNSVRICNAHYEQEYRPSGTVIVPKMQCYWSG
ncbi:MAG TPA: hypothetical protein VGC26_07905 [Afipia sp.]